MFCNRAMWHITEIGAVEKWNNGVPYCFSWYSSWLSISGEPEQPIVIRPIGPILKPELKSALSSDVVYPMNIILPRIITCTSSWRAFYHTKYRTLRHEYSRHVHQDLLQVLNTAKKKVSNQSNFLDLHSVYRHITKIVKWCICGMPGWIIIH